MGSFGIDVSQSQSGISYTTARDQGVDFVIVKASGFNTGSLYVANGYHGHVDAARAAGLKIGHYFVPGRGSPITQANHFVDTLHSFDAGADVLALDNEPLDSNAVYFGQDQAFEFLSVVQSRTGIPWQRLWLYCPASLTRSNPPWTRITDRGVRVWWSAYGAQPTGHQPDHVPSLQGKIVRWDVHQYSSSVTVAGRIVDANVSPHSMDELFGGAGGAPLARAGTVVGAGVPGGAIGDGPIPRTATEDDGVPGPIFFQRLQLLARSFGYAGPIDGVMGENSWAAVMRKLARDNGYFGPCDGRPGPNTFRAMQRWAAEFGYTGPIDGSLGPNGYKAIARALNQLQPQLQ